MSDENEKENSSNNGAWISVGDEMPKTTDPVITYWTDGVIEAYGPENSAEGFIFAPVHGHYVLFWQPLPKAPYIETNQ